MGVLDGHKQNILYTNSGLLVLYEVLSQKAHEPVSSEFPICYYWVKKKGHVGFATLDEANTVYYC